MVVDNIRALCQKNNTSIWQLERDCGIGNGVIARWANVNPRVDVLKKVADHFGVTLDELMRDDGQ